MQDVHMILNPGLSW